MRPGAATSQRRAPLTSTCVSVNSRPVSSISVAASWILFPATLSWAKLRLGMALQPAQPFFCNNIGNSTLNCCFISDQSSKECNAIFGDRAAVFGSDVPAPNYLQDCANLQFIYSSVLDNTVWSGTGTRPYQRYQVCASLSNMIDYRNQSLLGPNIRSKVEDYVPTKASSDQLKNISRATTDCLTATCQNARDVDHCSYNCSAVNLLINSTTPNVEGIHQCLHALCTGNQTSLPFADADVVGIGVCYDKTVQCQDTNLHQRFLFRTSCNACSSSSCGSSLLASRSTTCYGLLRHPTPITQRRHFLTIARVLQLSANTINHLHTNQYSRAFLKTFTKHNATSAPLSR